LKYSSNLRTQARHEAREARAGAATDTRSSHVPGLLQRVQRRGDGIHSLHTPASTTPREALRQGRRPQHRERRTSSSSVTSAFVHRKYPPVCRPCSAHGCKQSQQNSCLAVDGTTTNHQGYARIRTKRNEKGRRRHCTTRIGTHMQWRHFISKQPSSF
jgi:hypothetical protein